MFSANNVRLVQIGEQFDRLRVVGRPFFPLCGQQRKQAVVAQCRCGAFVAVLVNDLRRHRVNSCGCLRRERAVVNGSRRKIHGGRGERLYRVWASMRRRCHDKKCKAYAQYGAKGIVVCEEWRKGYASFRAWAVRNGYQPGLTIDRKKPRLGYEPGNCQWITQTENSRKVWTDMAAERQALEDRVRSLEAVVLIQNALLAALAGLV